MKTLFFLFLLVFSSACVAPPLRSAHAWPPPLPAAPSVSKVIPARPTTEAKTNAAPPAPRLPASRPVCFSRSEIAAILRSKERLRQWPKMCDERIASERKKQEILCKRERDERDALLRDCRQKKQPVCGTLCWIGIGSGVVVGIGIGVGITIVLERTRR